MAGLNLPRDRSSDLQNGDALSPSLMLGGSGSHSSHDFGAFWTLEMEEYLGDLNV